MNRRSFLAALSAPLIAQPTLEEIERLTWRRRFFPGYSPEPVFTPVPEEIIAEYLRPAMLEVAEAIERDLVLSIGRLALPILGQNLVSARLIERRYSECTSNGTCI